MSPVATSMSVRSHHNDSAGARKIKACGLFKWNCQQPASARSFHKRLRYACQNQVGDDLHIATTIPSVQPVHWSSSISSIMDVRRSETPSEASDVVAPTTFAAKIFDGRRINDLTVTMSAELAISFMTLTIAASRSHEVDNPISAELFSKLAKSTLDQCMGELGGQRHSRLQNNL